jgi:hypothetical protein
MSEVLYQYRAVEPATWFYLSSLLLIGLFFKFGRFWSVRNLDLVLLILLGPGLLFVSYGQRMEREARLKLATSVSFDRDAQPTVDIGHAVHPDQPVAQGPQGDSIPDRLPESLSAQKFGFVWLFIIDIVVLARLFADPTMVRRPLLEPNLTGGGLTFIGCSLFVFLMANVICRPANSESQSPHGASIDTSKDPTIKVSERHEGPGYAHLRSIRGSTQKVLAISAHLLIVLGMVLIGYWHFENIVMGVGAATLYLMLPYTSLMTNQIQHAIPAAFLVTAVLCYRQPLVSGAFLGLASGLSYYPLFLLPLWLSFYWSRGLARFMTSFVLTLAALTVILLIPATDPWHSLRLMFGIMRPATDGLNGIWDREIGGWNPSYRIPILAAFMILAFSMILWPPQKNLGTLLSCSAAIMVACQLWHGYGGGTFMAWYLPLLLLTIFRPNLEDRVALSVLGRSWLPRRLSLVTGVKAA